MKCPACGYTDSKVVDSRPTDSGSIRRRRECLKCQKRFTTYEIIDTIQVFVIKKDGSRQEFDRNKLLSGITKACYKRPVTTEQLSELVDDIEQQLSNLLKGEVHSTELGEMAMERLRKLDEVSYVRFASVYREFKDVDTFMREILQLRDKQI